jgi:release factor glutamine methyltransferase
MTATLLAAWTAARKRLEGAGVDSPVIDARLLLQAAAGASRTDIVTDPYRPLTSEQESRRASRSATSSAPRASGPSS